MRHCFRRQIEEALLAKQDHLAQLDEGWIRRPLLRKATERTPRTAYPDKLGGRANAGAVALGVRPGCHASAFPPPVWHPRRVASTAACVARHMRPCPRCAPATSCFAPCVASPTGHEYHSLRRKATVTLSRARRRAGAGQDGDAAPRNREDSAA